MECESCLFDHGSKPDGKVWVTAALGDDIMNIHLCVCVCVCVCVCMLMCAQLSMARTYWERTHATFVSECRVRPSSVSCSGRSWE